MSSSSATSPRELPRPISGLDELAPFSDVRLVAFDLDGTLLRDTHSLPGPRLLALRRSTSSYQVKLTVATGRTLWGAKEVISALGGLENTPVVLYNGSVVVAGVEVGRIRTLQRLTIPPAATSEIATVARELRATVFAYEFRDTVIDDSGPEAWPETVFVVSDDPESVREFNGMPPKHCALKDLACTAPSAILILPRNGQDYEALVVRLASVAGVSITGSGGRYIEIRPFGASKARGFEVLANALGIPRAQVLAVGDNDNDVELLEWAGLSVVVNGASDAACRAATYISRQGAERAAIELLDLVRQARRLKKGRTRNGKRGNSEVG